MRDVEEDHEEDHGDIGWDDEEDGGDDLEDVGDVDRDVVGGCFRGRCAGLGGPCRR